MKYQHEELIQTTQQKDKRIEELELKHEELIQTSQQKDKRIEELELKHEELIQTTQQKDKRIEELKLKHEELIQTTQPSPVCPNISCRRNIPLENMFEHMKGCDLLKFNERELKLNTEVSAAVSSHTEVFKLEESRDWFIYKTTYFNNKLVLYIIHHSEEETKDVFYYSLTYFEKGVVIKSGPVRCAPMGISFKDAVQNNFTTNIPDNVFLKDVKFTVFKA